MLWAAMEADCDNLHENVITWWRHCKKKKKLFEQVNSTDTPNKYEIKLYFNRTSGIRFFFILDIRVRPTFIFFHYFAIFRLIRIRPFDWVCMCCLSLRVLSDLSETKTKTSNRFQFKCYSPCRCYEKMRKRMHFHCIIMCTSKSYS